MIKFLEGKVSPGDGFPSKLLIFRTWPLWCGQPSHQCASNPDDPVMNESLGWVADILARQDGVIARRQALQAGMSPAQVRQMVSTGRWETVQPSVHRSLQHLPGTAARVRSAVLWAGQGAALSGLAAAYWWGLTMVEPSEVEVVVPHRRNPGPRPGITVIRRDLPADDKASVRAAGVTGLALSALFGAVALEDQGAALLDRALQTRVSFAAVRSAHYRTLGIRGSTLAGELLRAAADRSAAASERLFIGLLKDAGIRGWRVNYPWKPADPRTTVDIAFVREMLAIEIDGWAWHTAPDRFQRDRRKQNEMTQAGWTVLRFTWLDLTSRPADVVREVRQALERAR